MQRKKDVSTKPFYPFECADFYEKLLGKYDKIVSFHLSTELSGCYKSAVNAKLVPIERHRGKKPALKRLVTMAVEKNRQYKGNCSIWLAYAGNKEEALITRDKLAARTGRKAEEMQLAEVGATISVHAGPGSVCIAMSPH